MATPLPIPSAGTTLFDPSTGTINPLWENFFLQLTIALGTQGFAPADARYWVSNANGTLTNERNMGALASGYLKQVSAVGIATPSTVSAIPLSDVTGLLGLAQGGTDADLSATGGANQVLQQASVGGGVTVGQLATTNLSDVGTNTAWTPTDASGAGLSFTTATGRYLNVGKLVYTEFDLTYPVTASAAAASIGGLPFTSIGVQQALSIAFTNLNIAAQIAVNSSATTISFLNLAGGTVTNAQFSGVTIRGSGIWMHT